MAKSRKNGDPVRYLPDWSRVATSKGVKLVYCPDHPHAWVTGYVPVHRFLVERQLGRLLKKRELVRFVDNDAANLTLSNLKIISPHDVRRDIQKRPPPHRRAVCWWCREVFYPRPGPLSHLAGRFPFCKKAHLTAWKRAHAGKFD